MEVVQEAYLEKQRVGLRLDERARSRWKRRERRNRLREIEEYKERQVRLAKMMLEVKERMVLAAAENEILTVGHRKGLLLTESKRLLRFLEEWKNF